MFDHNPLQSMYLFEALRSHAEDVRQDQNARPGTGVGRRLWNALATLVAACRTTPESLWEHAAHPGVPAPDSAHPAATVAHPAPTARKRRSPVAAAAAALARRRQAA